MLSGELKWGAFRCAELFCLPSHQENFGIVVAEALACGLPVAIAEPVNISAEVAAADAGLVHDDTVAGTTAALRQWLALPAGEKQQMGVRGQRGTLRVIKPAMDDFDFLGGGNARQRESPHSAVFRGILRPTRSLRLTSRYLGARL